MNLKSFLLNPERKHIGLLVNVFLVLSVLYFFSSIFYGLDFTDSFYHLNQALYPANDIYLNTFFLSSVIIKGIIGFVGPEVIYLRFLNSLMLFFSVLIPFFLIKIEKPREEVLFYIVYGLFLFSPFNVNILGYDSISIFILSLIFSLSVLYLQKANLYVLLLLSFIGSLAVLIRLPNIIVVPIVLLVIGISGKIQKGHFSWKPAALFLGLTLLLVFFGFSMYYSQIDELLGASANSSSHDLNILFYNYFLHGLKILSFITLISGGYFVFKKSGGEVPKLVKYVVTGLFFIILIGVFVIRSKYSQNYSLFLTAFALSIIIVHIIRNRKNWLSIQNLVLYLYVLFLFINPFGSNTGLLKAVSLFLLLPFVLSFTNLKPEKYWLLILIVLVPFSFIEKLSGTYEDNSIPVLNTTLTIPALHPVKTTKTRAAFLEKIDSEISELKKNNVEVYFYGDKSHIFHYLYPETAMNINSFFQPVEELMYYSQIEQKLQDHDRAAIFIIDSYPVNDATGGHSLEEKLLNEGFEKLIKAPVHYYLKIKNNSKKHP